MISKVTVFHRGGAVLWTSDDDGSTKGNEITPNGESTVMSEDTSPSTISGINDTTQGGMTDDNQPSNYLAINKLIQTVLLSDKSGQDSMVYDSYTLKWTFENNLNLVFVAVYFSFQKLLYVDDFLQTVKNEFIKMFNDSLKGGIVNLTPDYSRFYIQYKRIQKYYKTHGRKSKKAKQWKDTNRGKQQQQFRVNDGNKKKDNKSSNKPGSDDPEDDDDSPAPSPRGFGKKFGRKASKGPRGFDKSRKSKSSKNVNKKNGKKGKGKGKNGKLGKPHFSEFDVLNFKKKKVTKEQMDEFNFALTEGDDGQDVIGEDNDYEIYAPDGDADLESTDDDSSSDDFDDLLIHNRTKSTTDQEEEKKSGGITSGIWSRFSKLIGNKPLTEQDVNAVLQDLENSLSSKNVANVIARELCDSLRKQLVGKEIGTFNTIRSVVKTAMTDSLERILTPTRPINILHGIKTAQEEGRPYVIVFIGVNGVGKSTSLSKTIYYLKSRNLKVSVAACDTFRSGAVEQLKTHCRALNVRLFSQGYARDAGAVAKKAVEEARNKYHDDVVLIDTAGRMQNNAPLMRSLVSLIQRNKPDLTLFVGEALVGNDGVDQLMEFNRALKVNNNSHLIDGVILTKFDTVDDKVGAAISMTYKSRKPIVFIGTGQNYPDLKRMHVRTLINKLLQ